MHTDFQYLCCQFKVSLSRSQVLMGATPEQGTPADETHIVRASAVLRDVRYGEQEHLVSYDAAEAISSEKIRVPMGAVAEGIIVYLDDLPLERVGSALEVGLVVDNATIVATGDSGQVDPGHKQRRGVWSLDKATSVIEVGRVDGGRVSISPARSWIRAS